VINKIPELQPFYDNGHDPLWRLENLYSIVNKDGQKVPYTPNPIQDIINNNPALRKIILKARQFGISTNELIKLLDWTIFTENATAGIIAHEQDAIEKLFRIVRRAYDFLPEQIRPHLDRGGGSKYQMYFPEINSRIYCDLEVRGDTIGKLHVSEAAFMKDSARLKATLQAVPLNKGMVTIETTPNGMANYFYDLWCDPDAIYEKLFFPWYMYKDYNIPAKAPTEFSEEELKFIDKAKRLFNIDITPEQMNFRRFKRAELKTSTFDIKRVPFEQEYPEDDQTCFLASGTPVIDPFKIKEMMDNAREPIRIQKGIKIFQEISKDTQYVVGADTSEGVGLDYSAGVMIDVATMQIAAIFHGQLQPGAFADKLVEMSKLYTTPNKYPPLIAVERNNHGHTVLFQLDQLSYPNIYVNPKDERPGWTTNTATRPLMLDRFIQCVEGDYFTIPDKTILAECLTLVDNNGKIEAATGKHDDLIIACSIALQVLPDVNITPTDISTKIKL
jgi:hypothetical protein